MEAHHRLLQTGTTDQIIDSDASIENKNGIHKDENSID